MGQPSIGFYALFECSFRAIRSVLRSISANSATTPLFPTIPVVKHGAPTAGHPISVWADSVTAYKARGLVFIWFCETLITRASIAFFSQCILQYTLLACRGCGKGVVGDDSDRTPYKRLGTKGVEDNLTSACAPNSSRIRCIVASIHRSSQAT